MPASSEAAQIKAVTDEMAAWLQEYVTGTFIHHAIIECAAFAGLDDDAFDYAYEALRAGKFTVSVKWEAVHDGE